MTNNKRFFKTISLAHWHVKLSIAISIVSSSTKAGDQKTCLSGHFRLKDLKRENVLLTFGNEKKGENIHKTKALNVGVSGRRIQIHFTLDIKGKFGTLEIWSFFPVTTVCPLRKGVCFKY